MRASVVLAYLILLAVPLPCHADASCTLLPEDVFISLGPDEVLFIHGEEQVSALFQWSPPDSTLYCNGSQVISSPGTSDSGGRRALLPLLGESPLFVPQIAAGADNLRAAAVLSERFMEFSQACHRLLMGIGSGAGNGEKLHAAIDSLRVCEPYRDIVSSVDYGDGVIGVHVFHSPEPVMLESLPSTCTVRSTTNYEKSCSMVEFMAHFFAAEHLGHIYVAIIGRGWLGYYMGEAALDALKQIHSARQGEFVDGPIGEQGLPEFDLSQER